MSKKHRKAKWQKRQQENHHSSEQQLTKHHLKPRSRGGSSDEKNIKLVPRNIHRWWHRLFENCESWEIVKKLEIFGPEIFIKNNKHKENTWEKLFGKKTLQEVVEIIKKEWSSPEEKPYPVPVIPKNLNSEAIARQ